VLTSDVELTDACSVILSVVPPRDAAATAQRLIDALVGVTTRLAPLYFADLNAVAPSTCRAIAASIEQARVPIRFVDGAIIGGPPKEKEVEEAAGDAAAESISSAVGRKWHRPSIPTSGPHKISDIPDFGARLFETLNMRHIGADVGAASGLKMCFASTTKGFTAIAIQSFTTAQRLGVLDELRRELDTTTPAALRSAERGVVAMAPKAYRWVREMEEIALTFQEDGGFDPDTFQGIAKVYKAVANDSELGQEKVGKRKRGTTVEDMATALAEGMDKRKKKNV
jgi:3-hydroxyisobutyrate dehydrogenase-like beta-hydroxyacid dehydrogenase